MAGKTIPSARVLKLRQQLLELARQELERRRKEEEEAIDPAEVERARQELMRIYDQMAERLGIP